MDGGLKPEACPVSVMDALRATGLHSVLITPHTERRMVPPREGVGWAAHLKHFLFFPPSLMKSSSPTRTCTCP